MEPHIANSALYPHQALKPGSELLVIYVDNDEDDREIIADAMTKAAPYVQFMALDSCDNLLKKLILLSPLPHLIILDLNLPKMSGLECLKRIRANTNYAGLPVIIYSTSNSPADIDAAKAGGALLYIRKPSLFSDVVIILKQVISNIIANPAAPQFDHFYLNPERKR